MADYFTTSGSLTFHQQLKTDDLLEVSELLKRNNYGATSFYDLGLYLGLSSTTLDVIAMNHKGDVLACLRECLNKWLQKADDVKKKGDPTIYLLVSALRRIEQNAAADAIQKQLDPACSILDRHMTDELLKILPQLVIILHSEGIIGNIMLPPNDPLDTIKEALQKGVAADPHNLKKFVKVLKKIGALQLANSIEQDLNSMTSLSTEAAGQRQQILPPKDFTPMIFEDQIYGAIVIDHPLIEKIIKTCQFQRLKDIKQLGYTYQSVPKANHSKLQHSIGMYHLAGEYVKELQRKQPELNITESDVLCVQIAALCFNLGHGPFSHTFEMFLDELCKRDEFDQPWRNISEASVEMFEHMYLSKDNHDLKDSFEKYFDNSKEDDIAFIKKLILGVGYEQHKDKRFLFEIIVNKRSGLDVRVIDSTVRDAAVLGVNVTFNWRKFLSKVRVFKCDDDELHICFQKEDLETYNELFRTRHTLFRELYYVRRNRIVALMIARILVKSNDTPMIRDRDRRVTLFEATKNMSAYTQLNDGILNVIRLLVDDPEVQLLLGSLESMKIIGQIGFVTPTDEWKKDRIKQHIADSCNIAEQLIIDSIKNGYEDWESLTQYFYYTSDGKTKTGQWKQEWAEPSRYASSAPIRIFLVSGDRNLIKEVKQSLLELKTNGPLNGEIYPNEDNCDLLP